MQVLEDIGAELVPIPPRSPDLNPIENFFHLVCQKLDQDSITKIVTNQTVKEFEARVRDIFVNFVIKERNKLISSIKRYLNSSKEKGPRIKW